MNPVYSSPAPAPARQFGPTPTVAGATPVQAATLDWSDAALARTWRTAGITSLSLGVVLHACTYWIPGTVFLLTGTWAVLKGSPQWRRA
jgi:hypothetical protein